jgi:hypothetical protein
MCIYIESLQILERNETIIFEHGYT